MSNYNQELAQRTLDFIEAHPEHLDQETYICDTSACIAGIATILDQLVERDLLSLFASDDKFVVNKLYQLNVKNKLYQWKVNYPNMFTGAEALGLNNYEASFIFHDMNEERAIEKLRYVANGRPLQEHPDWPSRDS